MTQRIAVLASGGGSNLQSLIDSLAGHAAARIALVVSDRAGAGALQRARDAGIPAIHVPVAAKPAGDGGELMAVLREHGISLVVLAGYLRLVPGAVTAAYRGRMVNIHPALLPSFGGPGMYGRHVHDAVLRAGCRVSGATVHLVDERYDEGRILAQWPVPVFPGDTAESLAARVLRVEHALYPVVVARLASSLEDATGGSAAVMPAADIAAVPPAADMFVLGSSNSSELSADVRTLADQFPIDL